VFAELWADDEGFGSVPVEKRRQLDGIVGRAAGLGPDNARHYRNWLERHGAVVRAASRGRYIFYLPMHPTVEAERYRRMVASAEAAAAVEQAVRNVRPLRRRR